jgi:hypothetical protein
MQGVSLDQSAARGNDRIVPKTQTDGRANFLPLSGPFPTDSVKALEPPRSRERPWRAKRALPSSRVFRAAPLRIASRRHRDRRQTGVRERNRGQGTKQGSGNDYRIETPSLECKDPVASIPTGHDVVERAFIFNTDLPRHRGRKPRCWDRSKLETVPCPLFPGRVCLGPTIGSELLEVVPPDCMRRDFDRFHRLIRPPRSAGYGFASVHNASDPSAFFDVERLVRRWWQGHNRLMSLALHPSGCHSAVYVRFAPIPTIHAIHGNR